MLKMPLSHNLANLDVYDLLDIALASDEVVGSSENAKAGPGPPPWGSGRSNLIYLIYL